MAARFALALALLAAGAASAQVPPPPSPGAAGTPAAPGTATSDAPSPDAPKPAAPEGPNSQRVEVTGGRGSDTEQRRQSTVSKIVIGREEIERQGDSTLGEILKRLPGV
ncbi:MAG TPA: hypothetical protein VLE45_07625, partial [Burkholderiaceae bacterium]|nr:hypothetical protein [Burkholderiaceae bacterium]